MQTGLVAAGVALVVLGDIIVLLWLFRRSGLFQRMAVEAVVQPETWIAYVVGSPVYAGVSRDMMPVELMLRENHGISPEAGFSLYLDDMTAMIHGRDNVAVLRKLTGCVISAADAARVPPETRGFWLARLPETAVLEVRYPRREGKFAAFAGFRAMTALLRRVTSEGRPFRAVMESCSISPAEMRYACLLDLSQEHLDLLYDACR